MEKNIFNIIEYNIRGRSIETNIGEGCVRDVSIMAWDVIYDRK